MGDIGADREFPDRPLTAEGRVLEVERRLAELTRTVLDLELVINRLLNWVEQQQEAQR